jgi:hypothetical protein
MSAVLKHIAAVAKGLNKAELHVLIELESRAESAGGHDAMASSRDLAEQTGLARSSVQLALDALHKKGLIHSDAGSATRPALHRMLFLDAVEAELDGPNFMPEVARKSGRSGLKSGPLAAQIPGQGGPPVRPGVARNSSLSGLNSGPGVAQLSGQGGLIFEQPVNEKSIPSEQPPIERVSAPAKSIENDFDTLIDRLQKAKKSDFEESLFEFARNQIASHHAKFAREENRLTVLPDDAITSQFLAVAEWPKLAAMLFDLSAERKEAGHSYGWYVTVALQRIHGISPSQVRETRARLKDRISGAVEIGAQKESPRAKETRLPYKSAVNRKPSSYSRALDVEALQQQVRSVAAAKSFR